MLPEALLLLLFVPTTFGWKHSSRNEFESVIRSHDLVLVAFVAPWTESSKQLEEQWSLASSISIDPLLSIDCTIESTLCSKYDVLSYPAIRLFRGLEQNRRYKGPRKATSIVAFMQRAALPTISFLSPQNLTTFTSIDEAVFVAYLTPEEEQLKLSFQQLATRNSDRYSFGLVSDASLAPPNIPIPSIVCYRARDGENAVFSAQSRVTEAELDNFVKEATRPLIGEFNRRTEPSYLKSATSLTLFFSSSLTSLDSFASTLSPLAKKYKEYLSFATVDANEYGHMMPRLGMSGLKEGLVVWNTHNGMVFVFDTKERGEIGEESVEGWLSDIVGGRVAPIGSDGESKEEEQRIEHGEIVHDEI